MLKIGAISVLDADRIDEVENTLIVPQFDQMWAKKFTIAPGLTGSYWLNMRTPKFAAIALKQMLVYLVKEIEETKIKDQYVITETAKSLIYAIINAVVTYGDEIKTDELMKSIDTMFRFNIHDVSQVFLKIQMPLTQSITFRNMIDFMIVDQKNATLNDALPPLFLQKLIRFLRFSTVEEAEPLFNDIKGRLDISNTADESIILLHFLKLIVSLFPGKFNTYYETILPLLISFLAKPMPISEMARDLGLALQREKKYVASTYYSVLFDTCSKNIAFDGTIPVLFDQKCAQFTNYMYTFATRFNNIQSSMINFIQFFIKNTIRSKKTLSTDKLISIVNTIKFDDESIESIKTKYKLKEDIPAEEKIDSSSLLPPLFQLKMCRISLTFPINIMLLTPFADGKFMFISPMPTILDNEFIRGVKEHAKELDDETSIINQPIVLAGDDFLITNVLQGLVSSYISGAAELARVVFTFYLLPIDHNSVNEVALALSRTDPLYNNFVKSALTSSTQTGPANNEESTADFPPILKKKPLFDHNTWFSDSSPSSTIQFAIQHYLLFAHYSVSVNVWACELEFEADPAKIVVVPFITSVHIGDIFAGKTLAKPAEISSKTIFNLSVQEVMQERETFEKQKIRSLSVWNACGEMNVRPTDGWIYVEWTKDKLVLTDENRRAKFASKITSKLITEIKIECMEKTPSFTAVIDQRTYGPLRSIKVLKMMDPSKKDTQLTMRFATFQTYQ
jgi:hypothetical protein